MTVRLASVTSALCFVNLLSDVLTSNRLGMKLYHRVVGSTASHIVSVQTMRMTQRVLSPSGVKHVSDFVTVSLVETHRLDFFKQNFNASARHVLPPYGNFLPSSCISDLVQ